MTPDTSENPYASPAAVGAESVAAVPDRVPRGFTGIDGLMLVVGLGVGIPLLVATRGEGALRITSVTDALSLYLVYYDWLSRLAQAAGGAVLARVWRYRTMPLAWEWLLLMAWVEFWPGRMIQIVSSWGGMTFYQPGGTWSEFAMVLLQWGWTFLLLVAAALALIIYLRLKTRLNPFAKVASLLGIVWLVLWWLLPSGDLAVVGSVHLFFTGESPQELFIVLGQISGLPRTIKWGVPLFAGLFAGQRRRRWTEWAGVPYFPMTLALGFWLGWSILAPGRAELVVLGWVSLLLGLGLCLWILRWRYTLARCLGLDDFPANDRPLGE